MSTESRTKSYLKISLDVQVNGFIEYKFAHASYYQEKFRSCASMMDIKKLLSGTLQIRDIHDKLGLTAMDPKLKGLLCIYTQSPT